MGDPSTLEYFLKEGPDDLQHQEFRIPSTGRSGYGYSQPVFRSRKMSVLGILFGRTKRERRLALIYSTIGVIAAASFIAGWKLYKNSIPAMVVHRLPGETAVITGDQLDVIIDATRSRKPCLLGHADRQLVHYNDEGEVNFYVPLNQSRIVHAKLGTSAFPVRFKLPVTLPNFTSGHYEYESIVYNGCGWLQRLFGEDDPIDAPSLLVTFAPVTTLPPPIGKH
jgi:hypothetical protein